MTPSFGYINAARQAYRSIKNAIVYADKEGGKEIQGDEIMKVRAWICLINLCSL